MIKSPIKLCWNKLLNSRSLVRRLLGDHGCFLYVIVLFMGYYDVDIDLPFGSYAVVSISKGSTFL